MRWLALLPILCALRGYGQDTPTFQSGVTLVHVDAEVTEEDRVISGLAKEDFQILDNGKPQIILGFSQDQEPLDLILLFDLSGSMIPKLEKVATAARLALSELRPGDHVAVMIFGSRTIVEQSFTADMGLVERAIFDVIRDKGADLGRRGRSTTRILSSIRDAALYIRTQPRTQRRRAIVIVSDNHGMISGRSKNVVRDLWEADAVLSGLQVRSTGESVFLTYSRITAPHLAWMQSENMTGVAERTGGDLLKGSDASASFRELMHRIRMRYSLYYGMPEGKPGEERQIKVALNGAAKNGHPQAKVRARFGYLIPKLPSGEVAKAKP